MKPNDRGPVRARMKSLLHAVFPRRGGHQGQWFAPRSADIGEGGR